MNKSSAIVELAKAIIPLLTAAIQNAKGTRRRKIYFTIGFVGLLMFLAGIVAIYLLE